MTLRFMPFLGIKGELTDFGTLGGDFVEVIGLNEGGEIVGQAQLPNSQTVHAFLAKGGMMTDLGTPDGNACSAAISINIKDQIVGSSDDCSGKQWTRISLDAWSHDRLEFVCSLFNEVDNSDIYQ
jgi:probable HAF family extracellular repeat protein